MPQVPIVAALAQLLVEVEGNIVFHQDGAGGRAVGGVLGHLRELQLRDGGPPSAHGLPQGGTEGRGGELLHHLRPAGARRRMCPGAPHQHNGLGESHQDLVPVGGRPRRQVVYPHGAAMGEGKRHVSAGHQHPWFPRSRLAGIDRHRAHRRRFHVAVPRPRRPGRPEVPAQEVPDPPCQVARHGRKAARPQHEVVEILIDGQEVQRRQDQRQQPHPAKRNIGNQQHTRQADGLPAEGTAATRPVLQDAAPVAHPVRVAVSGAEIRNHVERQFGKELAHARDEAHVQVVGSRRKSYLDFRLQDASGRSGCRLRRPCNRRAAQIRNSAARCG